MCAVRSSTTCAISAARLPASRKRSSSDDGSRRRAGLLAAPAEIGARGAPVRRALCLAALAFCAIAVAGCANLIGSRASATLSTAILDQDDPLLVESGLPAYLLLIEGLIKRHPDNAPLLSAGAQLFALYGSRFADAEHAIALTAKARRFGERAICVEYEPACHWPGIGYDELVEQLAGVDAKKIDALYSYGVSWLAHLDATSEDWAAVGELPWVEAVLERGLALDETYQK